LGGGLTNGSLFIVNYKVIELVVVLLQILEEEEVKNMKHEEFRLGGPFVVALTLTVYRK
jgi:hypothetical protein